jgi:hypothetical protein
MPGNYIPQALRPLVLSVACNRGVLDSLEAKVRTLEARIAAQDRLIEQLLMGGEMKRTNTRENPQIDLDRNTIYQARMAGRKAAQAGAPAKAPTDGYTLLMQRAWETGHREWQAVGGEGE